MEILAGIHVSEVNEGCTNPSDKTRPENAMHTFTRATMSIISLRQSRPLPVCVGNKNTLKAKNQYYLIPSCIVPKQNSSLFCIVKSQ